MSIDKLKTVYSTGAFVNNVKTFFSKINEIIDHLNGNGAIGTGSFKVFKASLTQLGTDNPFIEDGYGTPSNPFINTLGTISVVRTGVGIYEIRSSSLFTLGKTYYTILTTTTSGVTATIIIQYASSSVINIQTFAGGVLDDNVLNQTTVAIEVYS